VQERRRRSDAERNRSAVVEAAARLLRGDHPLAMRAVAEAAKVSRSTLYRHFTGPEELEAAVHDEAVAQAAAAIAASTGNGRPALAELRSAITALVEVGSRLPLGPDAARAREEALGDAGDGLVSVAERLAAAADLEPAPDRAWLRRAGADLVETALAAGWDHPG
jgi:AcrR family transcriptional regulator